MKTYYKISEIAHLLGLTCDAVRFYEKKGLVHPKIHPKNHYRMYTLENVLELLDIIYYRHLDMPIQDICEMAHSLDPNHVLSLLERKTIETKHRIWYEQQMLKKLTYLQSFMTLQQFQECEIREFPDSIILFEGENTDSFYQHQIQDISADEFVMCAIYATFEWNTMIPIKTYVALSVDVLEEFSLQRNVHKKINAGTCLYMRIKMENRKIPPHSLDKMKEYAMTHSLKLSPMLYVHEIPFTFYHDEKNYYAELFIPLTQ